MEKTDPMSIRQIIDRVMDRSSSREEFLGHRASALWPDIVGPTVNRATSRRYFSNGELHVYITSGALKNELSFQREAIARAINDALERPVVQRIVLH
jgi:hypothetical protein